MKHNNNIRRKLSIKKKLFIGFIVFVLISLAILWLCQVVLLGGIYKTVRINELKKAGSEITESSGQNFYSGASRTAKNYGFCILITDATGSVFLTGENGNEGACTIHEFSETDRANLISEYNKKADDGDFLIMTSENVSGGGYRLTNVNYASLVSLAPDVNDNDSVLYIEKFTNNNQTLYLLLNTRIQPVSAITQTLASMLTVISVLLIIIAVIFSAYISKTIARPIQKINVEAKQLAKGEYHGIVGGYAEIDELNNTLTQAAEELSKVEKLRKELISNMSHDLRTPLTLITGYSEVMRDIPDEMTSENLQTIIDESQRLTSLVNDMLDISKFESNNNKPNITTFNLTQTINDALSNYSKLTAYDGYSMNFIHDTDVTVNADRTMIMQAFYNLINNAITYTGEDRTVTVTQIVKPGRVRIEITDTGDGIEPDKLQIIWDRYYKASDEHRRAAAGSGLGLSIVKNIISLHKGSYGVRSKIGSGSTFWFELDTQ